MAHKRSLDQGITPKCWQILCRTDTDKLISTKRFRQLIERQIRSWGGLA